MIEVTVISDGYIKQDVAEALIDEAKAGGAASVTTRLNGIQAAFVAEGAAEAYRAWVLAAPELKGQLAGLSVVEKDDRRTDYHRAAWIREEMQQTGCLASEAAAAYDRGIR